MVLLLDLYNGEKISLISFPLSLLKKYTTTYEAQPPSKCTKLEQEALTRHMTWCVRCTILVLG